MESLRAGRSHKALSLGLTVGRLAFACIGTSTWRVLPSKVLRQQVYVCACMYKYINIYTHIYICKGINK